MAVKRPPVDVDLRPYTKAHGHSAKSLVVLHETVSGDAPGVSDIVGPSAFLAKAGLGIHLVVDAEGKSGWCYDPEALLYHCASNGGNVNTRSIGIEQVSRIPLEPSVLRPRLWLKRRRQLRRVAEWLAWLHQTEGIPLVYSDGSKPGITTHWDVSHTYDVPGGHWDCWPVKKGGHYPVHYVIALARKIVRRDR